MDENMWRMLKAELSAHKYFFLAFYLLPLIMLIWSWVNVSSGNPFWDPSLRAQNHRNMAVKYYHYNALIAIWFALVYSLLTKGYRKQTYRRMMLLPTPLRLQAITRVTLWLAFSIATTLSHILLSVWEEQI